MPEAIKTNPYGVSDFATLRRSHGYYVDQTWAVPELEKLHFQLFLRPRRFGKSLLLSILNYYYDVNEAGRFDELFAGTWIHEHPTERRNQYLVMRFDFSKVDGATLEQYQQSFESTCMIALKAFIRKYRTVLDGEVLKMVAATKTFGAAFDTLTSNADVLPNKIYILIDEYDNFSNHILTQLGEDTYASLCHGDGFFKSFFAKFKAASQAVERIFITGVSPMTMDDVTSGFNIAENISLRPQFATVCGFTHADVRAAMDYFAQAGQFPCDQEEGFRLVTDWHDHYRFSEDNEAQVINPTLFLNFLDRCRAAKHFPAELVDENLHTDYYKLRHLVTTNGRLNGKFAALETLVADGGVTARFVQSFQVQTLAHPESFLSLLFYYGMVTIGGAEGRWMKFVIPNLTMRQFLADFLLHGYRDACQVNDRSQELADALGAMAKTGDWRPPVSLAADGIRQLLCARDLLDGEKAVQAALAALFSVGDAYMVRTEHMANFGFADLTMVPDLIRFPHLKFAALIEVKYLKKSEKIPAAAKRKLLAAAKEQLEQYIKDHRLVREWRLKPRGPVTLIRLCVIFHGEELLIAQEI
ncbi:MAG: AAA family ATPase [Victivallales bacterium]|nr:AAA family ATPase [Victivallales bacterium]